jgi:hypothetical protein
MHKIYALETLLELEPKMENMFIFTPLYYDITDSRCYFHLNDDTAIGGFYYY